MPLRVFYFFSFGALGALFPYLPLLLAARGLDDHQISWVMVLVPVTSLVVPPLWGGLADALRARLPLLRLASFACAAAALLLLPDWGLRGGLLGVGLLSFFRAPLTSLADAATYSVMGSAKADFSRVRVWGSVGFVICVLCLGQLGASLHPVLLLGCTAGLYLLSGISLLPLRSPADRRGARERGVVRQSLAVLSRRPVLLFLLGNICYYLGHSTYDAYFGLHVERLGFDDAFIGWAWTIGVGAEIAVMLAAPLFLHRVRGGVLLGLCAAAASTRWGLLSVLTSRWALWALQLLHGVTFGLWYLSMVKFIQTRAPEHLRTSLQSISLSCMGLGMVAGYLVGGRLLDASGGAALYRLAACSAGVAMLLYLGSALGRRREGP